MMLGRRPWTCLQLQLLLTANLFLPSWQMHNQLCIGEPIASHSGDQVSMGSGAMRAFNTSDNKDLLKGVHGPCWDKAENNHALAVYMIKYQSSDINDKDNVLFGWFHIRINTTMPVDLIVLQPYVPVPVVKEDLEEPAYVPGSFVSTQFGPSCKEQIVGSDMNIKQVLAPCFYVPDPSTTVPNAISYARNPSKPIESQMKSARFNFQTDFPDCSLMSEVQHMEFRGYMTSISTGKICNYTDQPEEKRNPPFIPFNWLNQKKIFISNHAYGGFDPEPAKGHTGVSCADEVASGNPSWVTKHEEPVEYPPANLSKICWEDATHRDIKHNVTTKYYDSFVGRCSKAGDLPFMVMQDSPYNCFYDKPVGPILPPFIPPFGSGDCKKYLGIACEQQKNITKLLGITASSKIGKYVWGYRTTHGIALAMSTMLIIPSGALIARYYKETYMLSRFINIHVWHGVHISSAVMGFSGLLSGLVAAIIGARYFGYASHPVARVHQLFGWLSFLLFLVSIGSGPFRRFTMKTRILTIFFHFLLGTITRVLFALCLLTCFYIPGSPAGRYDIHIEFKVEIEIVIVLAWIVMDLAIHLVLQLQTISAAKKRKYAFCVPIPIIRPYFETDSPKTAFRNILLFVYVAFSFGCALALSVIMCWRDPEGRRYGNMGYTHKPNGKLNYLFEGSFEDENE